MIQSEWALLNNTKYPVRRLVTLEDIVHYESGGQALNQANCAFTILTMLTYVRMLAQDKNEAGEEARKIVEEVTKP